MRLQEAEMKVENLCRSEEVCGNKLERRRKTVVRAAMLNDLLSFPLMEAVEKWRRKKIIWQKINVLQMLHISKLKSRIKEMKTSWLMWMKLNNTPGVCTCACMCEDIWHVSTAAGVVCFGARYCQRAQSLSDHTNVLFCSATYRPPSAWQKKVAA